MIAVVVAFILYFQPVANARFLSKDTQFMSLKSKQVNLRTGPSTDFPIAFTYNLRFMPIKVVGEYDGWYKVVDMDGDGGWISSHLLGKTRTVITTVGEHILYTTAAGDRATHRVAENVVGKLLKCKYNRCKVSIGGIKGWLNKTSIWGQDE